MRGTFDVAADTDGAPRGYYPPPRHRVTYRSAVTRLRSAADQVPPPRNTAPLLSRRSRRACSGARARARTRSSGGSGGGARRELLVTSLALAGPPPPIARNIYTYTPVLQFIISSSLIVNNARNALC
uniref:Uncharacterized protein n=1 Tax=Sipha flava TaxID=143950 RepID=A0A2S2Q820_9HEMI